MDKGKAIGTFLAHVDRHGQLLLLTDAEMEELFGREVASILAELERFSQEENVCSGCGGDCCRDIGCELYAPGFDRCPIYQVRPIVCRLHFCHRFDGAYKSMVIELRDIFLGCFRAVELWNGAYLKWLDVPPLAGAAPELVGGLSVWVEGVRKGTLEPGQAVGLIRRQAEEYRNRYSHIGRSDDGTASP
ncbi:MAG: hypothetical protein DRI39_10720 [Chloroflexi bacterium]|nr:MAG: hypothetical protein DRI39_10720 [Chloroflexota bacterium]RLC96840.1 MAG: hypothetical protein DRI40_02030 [Chloroflexota bacterium]